jgi:hypothetical protein
MRHISSHLYAMIWTQIFLFSSEGDIFLTTHYTTNEDINFFNLRESFQWQQNVNIAPHPILVQRAVPVIRTGAMNISALIRNTVYFAIRLIMVPLAHRGIPMAATNMPAMANTAFIVVQQIPAVPVVQVTRINVTRNNLPLTSSKKEYGMNAVNNEYISEADLITLIDRANRDHSTNSSLEENGLDLSNLRTLTLQSCDSIKLYQGGSIILGTDELSEDVAMELAKMSFNLCFPNLKTLELGAATQIGYFKGNFLTFSGLESISPEAINALLLNFNEWLSLGLFELTADIARELGAANFCGLEFTRLKTLSLDAAFWLSNGQAILTFSALESISPEAAEILLFNYNDPVSFEKLQIDTMELAKAIANHPHELYLDGVSYLSPEIAEKLMAHKGYFMSLSSVKKIDLGTAEKLVQCENERKIGRHFSLGLEEIDVDVATVFSTLENILCLSSLISMSDEVALILSKAKCKSFNLSDEIEMSPFARKLIFSFPGNLSIRDHVTYV